MTKTKNTATKSVKSTNVRKSTKKEVAKKPAVYKDDMNFISHKNQENYFELGKKYLSDKKAIIVELSNTKLVEVPNIEDLKVYALDNVTVKTRKISLATIDTETIANVKTKIYATRINILNAMNSYSDIIKSFVYAKVDKANVSGSIYIKEIDECIVFAKIQVLNLKADKVNSLIIKGEGKYKLEIKDFKSLNIQSGPITLLKGSYIGKFKIKKDTVVKNVKDLNSIFNGIANDNNIFKA